MDVSARTLNKVEPIERETIRRATWRLMPLIMLGFCCSYLDRGNVGMAALTMNHDLGFSNAVFGFGAGVFFLGYFLAEIPSNLMLNKIGARRWLARIMLTWGLIAGLGAFVWNEWSFYGARILLGLAEAGYFPGVMLYLTWWFPSYYRTRMVALVNSATLIANIIGPPIGGLLLHMDGMAGLHGWQWLFLIETVPSLIMAVVLWNLLTDRPEQAAWLRPDQRTWLAERLASERAQREAVHKFSLGEAFSNPKMSLLTLAYFALQVAGYTLVFFMPLVVRGLGVSTDWVGLVSGLPFLGALVAMNYWSWHSDSTGERLWHVTGACLLSSAGLAACVLIGEGHPVLTMVALIVAAMGHYSDQSTFWSLPTSMLTGTAAAAGFALINSIGNLGGWLGPFLYGVVKDATGSTELGLLCLALAPVIASICILLAGHDRRLERIPSRG